MNPIYTVLGTTDEVNVCDCCGRKDLKGTVALRPADGSMDVFFGVVCAARATGRQAKEIKAAAKSADDHKRSVEEAKRQAAGRVQDALWQAFLDVQVPVLKARAGDPPTVNRFLQIQALGGIAHAKAMFSTGRE